MKFIVDGMLGKLSRWLRILGHNVKYSNNLDDAQLLTIAKKERRTLLTRDFELYRHATAKGIDAFYMEEETGEERLAALARKYGMDLDIDMTISRCPKCNTKVKPITKEEAAGKVEKSTFEHYDEFWKCPKCGQIYWQGAHWTRIRRTLEVAQGILENSKKLGEK
jgi:uncharacterized protein with PIN domain